MQDRWLRSFLHKIFSFLTNDRQLEHPYLIPILHLNITIKNFILTGRVRSEAPRPQAGASRARSGERDASKGNIVLIVPLDPTYKAGSRGTCRSKAFLFKKELRGYYNLKNNRMGRFVNHIWHITI